MATNLEIPLVHYSTDYVFSGEKEEGYKEDEDYDYTEDPINVYGATKALGEKLLQEHTDNFYLIRISWLFGPGGDDFVDAMLNLAENKDELTVVDDQYGKPTYAPDLAKATKEIVKSKKDFGIYHRTNETPGEAITWFDFASQVFKEFSKLNSDFEKPKVKPIPSEEFSRPAERPKYSILKNTKLPSMRDYQDALRDYLEQIKNTF
jgi:dTDP-4-dehydrorhamnose reductase